MKGIWFFLEFITTVINLPLAIRKKMIESYILDEFELDKFKLFFHQFLQSIFNHSEANK